MAFRNRFDIDKTLSSPPNVDASLMDAADIEVEDFQSEQERQRMMGVASAFIVETEEHMANLFAQGEEAIDVDGETSGDEIIDNPDKSNDRGENEAAMRGDGSGGLNGWEYSNNFQTFVVEIDDVDSMLKDRFLDEVRGVLKNIAREVRRIEQGEDIATMRMTPSEVFRVFVPCFLLQKICDSVKEY